MGKMMAQTFDVTNGNGDNIEVGTTGTIGSLMTRELDSMKHMPPQSDSTRRTQTAPVSVPCGTTPKKQPQPRRTVINESGSSSGSSSENAYNKKPSESQKSRHTPQKSGHRVPMLSPRNINTDRKPNREKPDKKGSSNIVEVVDLKCSNPMSNRLKKLGFSKLSESVI